SLKSEIHLGNPPVQVDYPYYAWLDDSDAQVTGDAVHQDDHSVTYLLPKCDACYFPSVAQVELAVCYMWKDKQEHGSHWSIGVSLTRFDDDDFPDSPYSPTTYEFTTTCYQPDIAYDFQTGDLYLTYTKPTTGQFGYGLCYRRFDRDTCLWSNENELWEQDLEHNAYTPRIDVGIVTDMDDYYQGDYNMVGIVYSGAGYDGDHDLDLYGVYWETSEPDYQNKADHHWELGSDRIYIPYLDIAPDSNGIHCYAVVYQRCVINQDYDYEVLEVNSISNTSPLRIYRYEDSDYVQPTVTIYYNTSTSGNHYSSISVLEETDVECWRARSVKVKLESGSEYGINNWYNTIDDYTITGDWNANNYNLPYNDDATYCGVSSAIIDKSNNKLWAGCCYDLNDYDDISASYGNTE
ncbi:MAG: hypothetical protein ABIC40_04530, partial [bacterium]